MLCAIQLEYNNLKQKRRMKWGQIMFNKNLNLLILYLLSTSYEDLYSKEISKKIENLTNGQIKIKEPYIYLLLNNLVENKYLSFFWVVKQRPRKYFKITPAGIEALNREKENLKLYINLFMQMV